MIEAWWRSLKHQWLFLHSLDRVATIRRLVAFYVYEHNYVLPHSAFSRTDAERDVLRHWGRGASRLDGTRSHRTPSTGGGQPRGDVRELPVRSTRRHSLRLVRPSDHGIPTFGPLAFALVWHATHTS
jgi:hypothetical protein